MNGQVLVLHLIAQRDTKNYTVYVDPDNQMNRLYLPKGLPPRIIATFDEEK